MRVWMLAVVLGQILWALPVDQPAVTWRGDEVQVAER